MTVHRGVVQRRESVRAVAELKPRRHAAGVGRDDQSFAEREIAVLRSGEEQVVCGEGHLCEGHDRSERAAVIILIHQFKFNYKYYMQYCTVPGTVHL